jgi:hypothetical protein
MKFIDLQRRMKNRPYFRLSDLSTRGPQPAHEKVQLSHWEKEGRVIRLKRSVYTLADPYRMRPPSALELAEPLYRPSYISLEYALSHYGLFPEAAGALTCVSTRKTARFQNVLGVFVYRHLKPDYFFGFRRHTEPVLHWLADPEKALLDFIYLGIPRTATLNVELFKENYRIQNLDILNSRRLQEMLSRFQDSRVQAGGRLIMSLMGSKRKQT